ncbi:GAF domain-containing protein [Deinococcus alpinitundrae]|uniref:GAF domain-containing protein n=1 Tax=Deinococcus alpinitundrae TaxID=468913 RepID=UPI0013796DF5|nr:GAF domain-containing protein [Deinococcus alpinitundrae]
MTSPLDADLRSLDQLSIYLQEITEALAATSTQREVIEIILTPAVQALGAVAGIVLLVDSTDQQMKIAGSQGYEDVTRTIWQEGPIEDHQLIADILRMHEALYFEHAGALKQAYPEIESRTGALAAVANATLPMFLDHRPLGVIVLDFKEPHHFTSAEQRFLRILSAQCAVALGRAKATVTLEDQVEERTRQLEMERTALKAFVNFTEEAGTETDVLTLAQRAVDVLNVVFPECSSGYYALEQDLWKLKVHSDDLNADPAVLLFLQGGIPLDTQVFAEPLRSTLPVFVDGWDSREAGLEQAEVYRTIGTYPLFVDKRPMAMFGIGLRNTPSWSVQEQGVFRAVGRSLELAIERTETARQLKQQNTELQARTRALESFAELTRDLVLSSEPLDVVERALQVIASLLPPGYSTYWRIDGSTWHLALQVGEVRPSTLQQAIEGGLPVGQTPVLDRPYKTGTPFFQEDYDPADDLSPALAGQLLTIATLPVAVSGSVVGIFSVGLFEQHAWSATDRAVLQTTSHSLELALERTMQAQQLKAQRDAFESQAKVLQATNEELEAFTYSVSHDLRTPVRHIFSFMALLRKSPEVPLGPKAQRYLQIIDDAAAQLNALIDAMLDLSRTSRQPVQAGLVDLGKLVTAGRAELEANSAHSQVEWRIGSLPLVTGDVSLLRRVMSTLLENAVKFSRTQPRPVVEIWAEEREREWAVFVRDNGVGFDPRYQDKLFVVFQRLHRQEEFEGVGVSLATARRIITRLNGTMFAQGEVGQGATFGFTLPK